MRRGGYVGVALTGMVVLLSAGSSDAAPVQAVIDLESGFGPGDIVSTLEAGRGIAGGDFGTVEVFGQRSDFPGVNQAMIFDGTCGGAADSCSGADHDLYQPQLGNILVISEDGDAADPDDADVGERIDFDFSNWGTGLVTVVSLDVLDVEVDESPGEIVVDGASVPIPDIGDGNVATLPVGLSGSALAVVLNGSGAIDNIVIEFEPPSTEPPTTAPPTTAPPTTVPPTTDTSTTVPPSTDTSTTVPPTTTSSTVVNLPPQAPTTTPPTPVTELPPTGGGAAPAALLAAGLVALGVGLVALTRRGFQ